MSALVHLVIVIASFVALAWSADRFVGAAAALALRLGMPLVLVGILIVGFGTSAPEMMVSALAALADTTGIAVGNAIGSNIANIALILGVSAAITPIALTAASIRTELLLLLAVSVLIIPLLLDGRLGHLDGALMLGGLVAVMTWLVVRGREADIEVDAPEPGTDTMGRILLWLSASLAILLVSAQLLVTSASALARMAGISDLVIGLSIVALGTSLPELATSIAAVRRRQFAMILGNILGSNLFNLLAVLGLAVLIRPTALDGQSLLRDYGTMLALTLALAVLLLWRQRIGRLIAVVFMASYAAYQLLLFGGPLLGR